MKDQKPCQPAGLTRVDLFAAVILGYTLNNSNLITLEPFPEAAEKNKHSIKFIATMAKQLAAAMDDK